MPKCVQRAFVVAVVYLWGAVAYSWEQLAVAYSNSKAFSQSVSQSSGRNYSGPENIFILGHHTCAYVCLYKCLSETSKPFLYDFNL